MYQRDVSRGGWAGGLTLAVGAASAVALLGSTVSAGPATKKLGAQRRELRLPATPPSYANPMFPPHFEERVVRTLDNTPPENPTTDTGALLGRVLFYDTRLSANGTTSCGSCHQQSRAFADPERVSAGYRGKRGDRNAMSLVNLRFTRGDFFWDERARTLEEAVLMPIHSRLEMGHTPQSLVRGVAADSRYPALFTAAFGSPAVTEERVARALSQFIRTLVSTDSRYDRAAAAAKSFKEEFAGLTAQENEGKRLFLQRCNQCHHIGEGEHVAFFGMFRSLINTAEPRHDAADGGFGDVTLNPGDMGRFKSPDLRNVAVTAPYMHDGRFDTLEQVIDHYAASSGIRPASRFAYTAQDKAALVAFLKTLTDERFLADPRFSDPWAPRSGPAQQKQPIPAVRKPASTATNLSPAERLARGLELREGETLTWLISLDKNSDAALSRGEWTPLVEVLQRTGVATLSGAALGAGSTARPAQRGNRPGAGVGEGTMPMRAPAGTAATPPPGDFNADGKVDETEARQFAALKRQIEMGDGGRLETIMDRLLARFELNTSQLLAVRSAIRKGRARLSTQGQAADVELITKLQSVLGPEHFTRYQNFVISGPDNNTRQRAGVTQQPRPMPDQIAAFDRNADSRLDRSELETLVTALEATPGGFGRVAEPPPGLNQFKLRLLTHYGDPTGRTVLCSRLPERMHRLVAEGDTNRDGRLDPVEIEVYVRNTAFRRVMVEGVYIGGGFGDVFVETAPMFERLELSPEKQRAVRELLEHHRQHLQECNSRAVTEVFRDFQAVVAGKNGGL